MVSGRAVQEPPDDELFGRAAAGDALSFEIIFRRYQLMVYRFARLMTGSPQAAEDVTQEVFLALLKNPHRFKPSRADFRTYVFGITRNLSRQR